MYRKVLEIELPDISYFKDKNTTRNDIVHRTSLTKIDRMTYRSINKADVVDMVGHIDSLLRNLSVYAGSSYKTIEDFVYRS